MSADKTPPQPQPQNPTQTTSGHVFRRIHKNSGSSKLIELLLGEISQDEGIKVNTLGDLFVRLKMKLEFECLDCGHKWAPEADALLESFEHTTELKDVRCSCEKCNSMKVSAHPVSM